MLRRGSFAGLLITLIGCGSSDPGSECGAVTATECGGLDGGSVGSSIVVDVRWLRQHLNDPDVQLIDTSSVGYDDVRLYDGSWSEWGSGELPVEQ